LCAYVASLLPSLGGLDALVFTAGIGENAAWLRESVCARLAFLGIEIDRARNQGTGDRVITTDRSRVAALAIHTEESWEIARDCLRLVP
jgi:acetate kinase